MSQEFVCSESVLSLVLFRTFISDMVVGVHCSISKAAAGTKFSQTAMCHPHGKELHKDLRKLSVGVKGGQRSNDADKYKQMHPEIKSSRWVYCMGLNTEMALTAQERVLSCC